MYSTVDLYHYISLVKTDNNNKNDAEPYKISQSIILFLLYIVKTNK